MRHWWKRKPCPQAAVSDFGDAAGCKVEDLAGRSAGRSAGRCNGVGQGP